MDASNPMDNKNVKGTVTAAGGRKELGLLGDAPILKSILKKAHRNLPPCVVNPTLNNGNSDHSMPMSNLTVDENATQVKGNGSSPDVVVQFPTGGNTCNVDACNTNVGGATCINKSTPDGTNKGPNYSHTTAHTGSGLNESLKTPYAAGIPNKSAPSGSNSLSFADMLKDKSNKKVVRVSEMRNSECVAGANVTIPLEVVDEVSYRFENSLYGYFIGKRLAFPIVDNYVKNTWAKFGLQRVMLHNGFFMFQFATKEGMERVLEEGPWLIRLVPIMLNIWTPNSKLKRDEITSVSAWVKIHNVPLVAYSENGLSLISTQLGHPIMLDAYTSAMCLKSWGRNSYARVLVEVSSLTDLLDSMVVAIPYPNGSGHSMEMLDIEYEWKPPRCATCKIFYHNDLGCPKMVKTVEKPVGNDDGFIDVNRGKGKGKQSVNKHVDGVRLQKPKVSFYYRPIAKNNEWCFIVSNDAWYFCSR